MPDMSYPESSATDITRVRGIQVPPDHGYDRKEEWMWVEENENGTITTFVLKLHVTVEPKEDMVGPREEVSPGDLLG